MRIRGPFCRLFVTVLAAVCLCASPAAARGEAVAAMTEREGLRRGVLGNGLVYVIVPHPSPAGSGSRVAVSLRIDSGSFSERDGERGAARAAEVLAWEAIISTARTKEQLAATGVRPEQDLRSSALYESSSFTLGVPATDPLVVRGAMESIAAALSPEPVAPSSLDRAAAMTCEQDRSAAGASMRVNREMLPRLLEGTLFATRMPLAVEAGSLGVENLNAYRARCYTAPNAGVVVAGDGLTPEALESLARDVFGRHKGGVRPADPEVGPVESHRQLALTGGDAGISGDFAQIARTFKPATGPSAATDALMLDVGCEALARRIDEAQRSGECGGVWSRALSTRLSRSLWLVSLLANGESGSALELGACLAGQVRRLEHEPLTETEVTRAVVGVLARYRREADEESSSSPEVIAERFADALGNRQVLGGCGERARDAEKTSATLNAREVSARIAEALDPRRAAIVALTPETGPRPRESDLLGVLNIEVPIHDAAAKQVEYARETNLHTDRTPGSEPLTARAVLSLQHVKGDVTATRLMLNPWTGVASATLPSGVRVLVREMPPPTSGPSRIGVAATFAFGQSDDPADGRGTAAALAAALRDPTLEGVSATELKRELESLGLTWEVRTAPDGVTLIVTSTGESLNAALGLVRGIRERGGLDAQSLRRLSARLRMAAEQAEAVPDLAVSRLYYSSAFPEETRMRPLTGDEAAALSGGPTVERVRSLLRSAPLTVSVAGKIDRRAALDSMTGAFADLAPAPVPAPRIIQVIAGAPMVDAEARIRTPDERSVVVEGWVLTRPCDVADTLALEVGAEWLSVTLAARMRDELGLASSVRVECRPETGWAGAGEVWAMVACAPGREADAARELRAALDHLTRQGPSESEVAGLRQRVAARRAEAVADPAWWAERLSTSVSRRHDLAGLANAPARALKVTAEEVRTAALQAAAQGRRLSLRVTPK